MLRRIIVLSEDFVSDFFREVENNPPSLINGRVLLCLMKLAYFCGLKKSELINLRIKDTQSLNGEILYELTLKKGNVTLAGNVRSLLQEHIEYLKNNGYPLSRNSPLFPRKLLKRSTKGRGVGAQKYNGRTLQRDLIKISREIPSHNVLDSLRWAGIFHYYESLKSQGGSSDFIGETARFARFDREYFERIIKYHWYRSHQ